MGKLIFLSDADFDGEHVRFVVQDHGGTIQCGVTANALKYCNCGLPHYGLIPAEEFVAAYRKRRKDIHKIVTEKHARGEFEPEGEIRILVHRRDLVP